MSDAPVVEVDLDAFWHDPYPTLARMRAETPICFVPQLGATLLTRRDDIHACEKNVEVFSSHQPGGLMNVLMGQNMMRRDGDDHRRERFVYYPAISPRAVAGRWAEVFTKLVDAVLDDVAPLGRADLVPVYAALAPPVRSRRRSESTSRSRSKTWVPSVVYTPPLGGPQRYTTTVSRRACRRPTLRSSSGPTSPESVWPE